MNRFKTALLLLIVMHIQVSLVLSLGEVDYSTE